MFYLLTSSILCYYINPPLILVKFLFSSTRGKEEKLLSRIATIQNYQHTIKCASTYIYKEQKQIIWIHQANCQKAMLNLIIHLSYIIEQIKCNFLLWIMEKEKALLN